MQSVKVAVRQIGIKNPGLNIYTTDEVSQEFEYNYGAVGYVLQNSHYLGEVKDAAGNIHGYKVMFVFTKTEEPEVVKAKASKNA